MHTTRPAVALADDALSIDPSKPIDSHKITIHLPIPVPVAVDTEIKSHHDSTTSASLSQLFSFDMDHHQSQEDDHDTAAEKKKNVSDEIVETHSITISYEGKSKDNNMTLAFIKVNIDGQLQWVVSAREFVMSFNQVKPSAVSNRLERCGTNTSHQFVFGTARITKKGGYSVNKSIALTATDAFQHLNIIINRYPLDTIARNAADLCKVLFLRSPKEPEDCKNDMPAIIIKKYQPQWADIIEKKARNKQFLLNPPVRVPLGRGRQSQKKPKKVAESKSQGVVSPMPSRPAPAGAEPEMKSHHSRSSSAMKLADRDIPRNKQLAVKESEDRTASHVGGKNKSVDMELSDDDAAERKENSANENAIQLHFKGTSAAAKMEMSLYFRKAVIDKESVWVVASNDFHNAVYLASNKSRTAIMKRAGINPRRVISFNGRNVDCTPFTAEDAYKRLKDILTWDMPCSEAAKKVIIANAVKLLKQLFARNSQATADKKDELPSAIFSKYLPKWAAAVESKQLKLIELTSYSTKRHSTPAKNISFVSVRAPRLKKPSEKLIAAIADQVDIGTKTDDFMEVQPTQAIPSKPPANVGKKRKRETQVAEDVSAMVPIPAADPVPLPLPPLSIPRLNSFGFFSLTSQTNAASDSSMPEPDFSFEEQKRAPSLPKLKADAFMIIDEEPALAKSDEPEAGRDIEAKAAASSSASMPQEIFSPFGDRNELGSLTFFGNDTDLFNRDGLDLPSLSLLNSTKRQRTS